MSFMFDCVDDVIRTEPTVCKEVWIGYIDVINVKNLRNLIKIVNSYKETTVLLKCVAGNN